MTRGGACEWDPDRGGPATKDHGCQRMAEVIVGAKGQWRLCWSCARLPRFKRMKVKERMAPPAPEDALPTEAEVAALLPYLATLIAAIAE